jgi:hypothetical protein
LRAEGGQALVEESLLLAALLVAAGAGALWLAKTHPQLLHAIDIAARSYYFAISLPFP